MSSYFVYLDSTQFYYHFKDVFQSLLRSLGTDVYKHYKYRSMECESMFLVTNHLPYLSGRSNSFSNSFTDFQSKW